MFALGILAIIQMTLLPGIIFNTVYKPKSPFFFRLGTILVFSMLINFIIIYLLTLLHLYTRTAMFILIGLELLAIFWFNRRSLFKPINQKSQKIIDYLLTEFNKLREIFQSENASPIINLLKKITVFILLVLAGSLVYWFIRRFTNNFGTVFNHWDAVVSWNAWAQSWAQGRFPQVHLVYPQLLPINLSIPYILINDFQIVIFSKAVMPVFALLSALVLFEFAIEKKKYGYLIGVVILYLLLKKFVGDIITEGYVDIPVAFISLMAILTFLRSEDLLQDKKELFLAFLFTAAACLMKQVGFYLLAFLPIIILINGEHKSKKLVLRCLLYLAIAALIVIPWYVPKLVASLKDFSQSGIPGYIAHSSNVHDSNSLFSRAYLALKGLGKYLILYALLVPGFFVLKKPAKLLIVFLIIPFTLLWAAIASYSFRNLTLVFPVLAIISGMSVERIMELVFHLFTKIQIGRIPNIVVPVLLAAVIIALGYHFTADKIRTSWLEKQKQIFSPEINDQLYALDFSRDNCNHVLTNYPVPFLPGLENNRISFYFDDFDVYQSDISNPSICWMLVPTNNAIKAIKNDIKEKLSNGTFQLLFSTEKWIPYQLIQIR